MASLHTPAAAVDIVGIGPKGLDVLGIRDGPWASRFLTLRSLGHSWRWDRRLCATCPEHSIAFP